MGFTRKKKMKKIKKSLKRVKYLLRKLKKTLKRNHLLNKRKRTLTLKGGAARPVATAAAVAGPPAAAFFPRGVVPPGAGPAPGFGAAFVPGAGGAAAPGFGAGAAAPGAAAPGAAAPGAAAPAVAGGVADDVKFLINNDLATSNRHGGSASKFLYLDYDPSSQSFNVYLYDKTYITLIGSHQLTTPLDPAQQVGICTGDMNKDGAPITEIRRVYNAMYVSSDAQLQETIKDKMEQWANVGLLLPSIWKKTDNTPKSAQSLVTFRDAGMLSGDLVTKVSDFCGTTQSSCKYVEDQGQAKNLRVPVVGRTTSSASDPGGKTPPNTDIQYFPIDESGMSLPVCYGTRTMQYVGLPGGVVFIEFRVGSKPNGVGNGDDLLLVFVKANDIKANRRDDTIQLKNDWVWDSMAQADKDLNQGNRIKKDNMGKQPPDVLMKTLWIKEYGDLGQVLDHVLLSIISVGPYYYKHGAPRFNLPYGSIITTCDKTVLLQAGIFGVPAIFNGEEISYFKKLMILAGVQYPNFDGKTFSALFYIAKIDPQQRLIITKNNLKDDIIEVKKSNEEIQKALQTLLTSGALFNFYGYGDKNVNTDKLGEIIQAVGAVNQILTLLSNYIPQQFTVATVAEEAKFMKFILNLKLISPLKCKKTKFINKGNTIKRMISLTAGELTVLKFPFPSAAAVAAAEVLGQAPSADAGMEIPEDLLGKVTVLAPPNTQFCLTFMKRGGGLNGGSLRGAPRIGIGRPGFKNFGRASTLKQREIKYLKKEVPKRKEVRRRIIAMARDPDPPIAKGEIVLGDRNSESLVRKIEPITKKPIYEPGNGYTYEGSLYHKLYVNIVSYIDESHSYQTFKWADGYEPEKGMTAPNYEDWKKTYISTLMELLISETLADEYPLGIDRNIELYFQEKGLF